MTKHPEETSETVVKEEPVEQRKSLKEIIRTRSFRKMTWKELFVAFKRPLLYAFLGFILILIATPIFTYLYFVRDLSSKESVISRKNTGVLLLDRNDKPFFSLYEAQSKKSATLEQIPDHMEEAVIAIEDRDFYEHPGFSLRGIGRAILANIREERLSQGGSTISQQLVKNTLLSQDKNFLRKYQEVVLALELERRFSKKDILEMYLNTVYFGEGAFGIEDAANTYFSKSANELTPGESALLAGILPAPSALSPLTGNKDRAFDRQELVLEEMQKQGYMTESEKNAAAAEKIVFNPQTDGLNVTAPHFALMVKEELIERYGEQTVARSGYTVKTTIDLADQEYAETTVKNQVTRLQGNNVTNGAAVALDPKTGEILALVGSWDWEAEENGKINMATRARQPGSSFKPFVYAKAFEDKVLTPASILEDKEITFSGNYKPQNYDRRFRGKVTVRKALANSLNIPALLALEKTGIPAGIELAERLGVTTLNEPSRYGLSLALGAAEVPLLEMTSAFGTFANEGTKVTPTTLLEIKDKKGKVIYTHEPESEEVLDDTIAFLISSILSDNTARQEVFGSSLTISRPAAVKTGTTNEYRDALTIGYTPSLVVGVWIGNNDRTPMDNVAGSLGAAPIWRSLMERLLAGTTVQRFTPPFGVRSLSVCRENGLPLKNDVATSSAYTEYFIRGTEPSGNCDAGTTPTPTPSGEPTGEPTQSPTNAPQPTDIPQPTDEPEPTQTDPVITVSL